MSNWTLADKMALNPPGITRPLEEFPLFAHAEAVRAAKATLAMAQEAAERTERVLTETMEHATLRAAKERLGDAKRAAVETSQDVATEREAVKAAKGSLKANAAPVVKADREARKRLRAARAALAEVTGAIVANIEKAGGR